MGWSDLDLVKNSVLFKDMHTDPRYYFVHSYHFSLNKRQDCLALTTYGYEFSSAFERGNIYGVQFHPEKSHKYGMQLLKNFAEL